ncbi:MAG: hypothetical protein H6709_18550 [Kofleriaceae bacterium]|nr:hypothetical protein [Myxococcales bacterium]MCB9561824.1 hypothetical protein [Kofleriaceae bacterium]MCB9574088.1 hypothetical protein [Kofleriaceae bacterium]
MKQATSLLVLTALLGAGCGTLFNSGPTTLRAPAGATIDGSSSPVSVDQKTAHEVRYEDGHTCVIQPGISAAYLILDIFATGLIGVVVDAVTGDWKVLKAGCPGITEG